MRKICQWCIVQNCFSCTYMQCYLFWLWKVCYIVSGVWSELEYASLTYCTNCSSSISSWATCLTLRPISGSIFFRTTRRPVAVGTKFHKSIKYGPIFYFFHLYSRETWPVHYYHHHHFYILGSIKINLLSLSLLSSSSLSSSLSLLLTITTLHLLFTLLAELFTICCVLITVFFKSCVLILNAVLLECSLVFWMLQQCTLDIIYHYSL